MTKILKDEMSFSFPFGSFFTESLHLGCCLAVGALLSCIAGQDISWDVRNYHLYNALSLMDDRSGRDFFAADKHSGLNPLLDLPYTYLALGPLAHWPKILAAYVGLWYGLLLFVTWKTIRILFATIDCDHEKYLVPVCFITAVTGGMALAQMSTTSNDITETFLLLTGLLFVLKSTCRENDPQRRISWAWAGLLYGIAAGAKLTSAVFAPALVLALLITFSRHERWVAALFFCASWIGGFAATFGWWGWRLWKRFENPFYPMLNGFFGSPAGPQLNLCDTRFFPRTFIQWIGYPFFWALTKTNHLVYEFDFRDPRLAIAYASSLLIGIFLSFEWIRSKVTRTPSVLWAAFSKQHKIIFIFFVTGYGLWLCTTSILRYGIVLEILAIPLALSLLIVFSKIYLRHMTYPVLRNLSFLMCALCLLVTYVPNWGHRPLNDTVFDVDLSWSKPHTLFLGIYEPVSFVVAFFPKNSDDQFMGLGFLDYVTGWPLEKEGRLMIEDHKGPIVALFREDKEPYLGLLKKFGLQLNIDTCHILKTNLIPLETPPILACEITRNV